MRPIALLLAAAAALPLAAADNVRFDVNAVKTGILLNEPVVAAGIGKAVHPNWIEGESKAGCFITAGFRIPPRTWTEVGIAFTPASDGKAELQLRGPHRPDPDKQAQTVLVWWDAVTATGTTVTNGGFEKMAEKRPECPVGWWFSDKYTQAKVIAEAGAAKEGANAFQAWHNEPITQSLTLTAGTPVTIKVWAWSEEDPDSAGKKPKP